MGFLAPDWNRFLTHGPATQAATEIRPRSTAPTTIIVTCAQRLRNPLELKVDGSEVEVFAEWPVLRIRLESSPPARPPMGRRGSNQ